MQLIPPNYFRKLNHGEIFTDEMSPLEIDLGCGDGSFLLALASQYPEKSFLGVERLLGRVRKVVKKAENASLINLKVLRLELSYSVEWLLPDDCASRVHLLFPDPWPKKKHIKRRLISKEFLYFIHSKTNRGCKIEIITDSKIYQDHIKDLLATQKIFEITNNFEISHEISTFHSKGLKKGHRIERYILLKI